MCWRILPPLSTAFCGCSLRLGSLIVAWIQLVILILFLVVTLFFILMGISTVSEIKNNKEYPPMEFDDDNKKIMNHVAGAGAVVLTVIAVVFLIQFIATILLLVGVQKGKPGYMKFWLVLAVTSLCFSLASIRMWSLSSIVFFVINAYFTWVVFSYYRQLKDCPGTTIQVGKLHEDLPQFVTPNAPPAYSQKPEHHV